jgi:hypothetical protein
MTKLYIALDAEIYKINKILFIFFPFMNISIVHKKIEYHTATGMSECTNICMLLCIVLHSLRS